MATSSAEGGFKFQWRWSERERPEAMENVVSVENGYHDITHKRGQRTFRVLDMLDGDALTAVEHLEIAEFAVDGGGTDFQHTRSQIS